MRSIFIVSAVRTPIGSFGGRLATLSAPNLGCIAMNEALSQGKIDEHLIEEVFMGCALQASLGQAPARQAALGAGIPAHVPCTTVNKVCGSGMEALISAARAILLEEIDLAVAGGMESMSRTPHALPDARFGLRFGDKSMVDLVLKDGLTDVYSNRHMGACMDLIAQTEKISKTRQDDLAILSYKRAIEANQKGYSQKEIVPVTSTGRKTFTVTEDEGLSVFDEAKLRRLSPAFRPDGTITAGNASSINDGAAVLVLASETAVNRHALSPLARIVSFASVGIEPEKYPYAPIAATRKALKKAGLSTEDIDYFEINEAFAAATALVTDALALPLDKVNVFGGAVSIGHPIGASGSRIVTTLLNVLKTKGARRGVATLCVGGGEGLAMVLERYSEPKGRDTTPRS